MNWAGEMFLHLQSVPKIDLNKAVTFVAVLLNWKLVGMVAVTPNALPNPVLA